MLSNFFRFSVYTATLPARAAIATARGILDTAAEMPEELRQLSLNYAHAKQQFEQLQQRLVAKVDAEIGEDPEEMTGHERESAIRNEITLAERHLAEAALCFIKVYRIVTANQANTIEHKQ